LAELLIQQVLHVILIDELRDARGQELHFPHDNVMGESQLVEQVLLPQRLRPDQVLGSRRRAALQRVRVHVLYVFLEHREVLMRLDGLLVDLLRLLLLTSGLR
jgi:hypothetical protein